MRRVAAIGLVLTLGCTTDMTSFEAGDAGSSRGVLIAGEATTFKTAAVAKMIEKLGTQEWHFRVIGLDELESHDTEGYGAILLVTAFKAGRIDGRVSRYLSRDSTDPRLLVFYTRGTEDPMPERSKPDIRVDVVSSASRDDRVDERAGQLAALLEQRF